MTTLSGPSLKSKIALAFMTMFVVCVGTISAFALHLFETEKKNSLAADAFSLVIAMADGVDAKLNLLHNAVIAVAASVPPGALADFHESEAFLGRQKALLSMFDNGLFLVAPDGRLMGEFPPRPARRGSNVAAREYFHQTINTRKPYISKPYRSTHNPGQPAVIMTAPVFNASGELIGLLYASLDLLGQNILADVSNFRIGKTGYMFMGVERETVIAHPDPDRIMGPLAKPGENRIIDLAIDTGFEGTGETVNSKGVSLLGAVKRLRTTGWLIGAMLPLQEFYAPIREARYYFLSAILLGTALLLLLAWKLVDRLIAPLADMTRQVDDMLNDAGAGGQIAVTAKDEIGVLARAFNRMLGKLLSLNAELEEKVREIQVMAFTDSLTQLPNRAYFVARMRQALAVSARKKSRGALLFIDLDEFKNINDTLGHDAGDVFLQQVAQRLTAGLRQGDTLARFGGDEFVVLLEDLSGIPDEAVMQTEIVCEKIMRAFDAPFPLAGGEQRSSPSIGATLFEGEASSVDDLLKQADIAMYQAKAAGGNVMRFFDPTIQNEMMAEIAMKSELRQALALEQFLLYCQPQVDAMDRVVGVEVLIRWRHPAQGLVYPAQFIPLAEKSGLIIPIGDWILGQACARLRAWADRPVTAHLSLAINISASQFRQPNFGLQVKTALEKCGADPRKLKLEITESMLLDDVEDTIAKMLYLKSLGVAFSLDDFGTGYSPLAYLKRLPLNQLKIDRSFVRDLMTDANDAAIARMIILLANSMELDVVSEGVETREQRDALASMGCRIFQGYLFGRPVPIDEFEELLTAHRGVAGLPQTGTQIQGP